LNRQIKDIQSRSRCRCDKDAASALRKRVKGVEILSGEEGINRVAAHAEADFGYFRDCRVLQD